MNLNVKIKRQIDKIEPFIKDKKNRPILVLSSWVLCGLSLILYSHYTRFDINRLEKSSRKELKKDQSLDIDGLTEKLEQLESVNAIEYFKETKHLRMDPFLVVFGRLALAPLFERVILDTIYFYQRIINPKCFSEVGLFLFFCTTGHFFINFRFF